MTTLADCIGHGVGVFLWCNACGHNAVLDASDLIRRLGPDFPVPRLAGRARCSACGSKDITTRPDWRRMGVIANHGPDRSYGSET